MERRMSRTLDRPRLAVQLFGRVELRADGRVIRLPGRHAQGLLALLALERRVRARDAVAAALWPEAPGAATSLRQALWLVRTSIAATGFDPDSIIDCDADVVGLAPGAPVEVDVERFEGAMRSTPPRPVDALAVYGGELAEGLGHECLASERERLSDLYEDALALVAEERLVQGDLDGARSAAIRLVSRDPLREEAHAVLIQILGTIGSRPQVVRQYRRLCSVLERELAVEPLPETEAVFRRAVLATVERSGRRVADAVFGGRHALPTVLGAAS
jgi:DNA-binding SARP family transcriptional activator